MGFPMITLAIMRDYLLICATAKMHGYLDTSGSQHDKKQFPHHNTSHSRRRLEGRTGIAGKGGGGEEGKLSE